MTDRIRQDAEGRIFGTTYPADRAPAGSIPLADDPPLSLRERLARVLTGVALRVLRVRPGDVIVIRGERPDAERVASIVRAVHKGNDGDPVAVFLPLDCCVHIEGRQINAEDRGGYRETATYSSDKAALPPRGVFTGVQDARDPPSDQCS